MQTFILKTTLERKEFYQGKEKDITKYLCTKEHSWKTNKTKIEREKMRKQKKHKYNW